MYYGMVAASTMTCPINAALGELIREAVFVGCADEAFFLAQSGTKLYLMDGHLLRSTVAAYTDVSYQHRTYKSLINAFFTASIFYIKK